MTTHPFFSQTNFHHLPQKSLTQEPSILGAPPPGKPLTPHSYGKILPFKNTTFYFCNFPVDWNRSNLLKLFSRFGKVVYLYLSKKKNKLNQCFGFVRYHPRSISLSILKDLSSLWIGSYKLWVQSAKFQHNPYKSTPIPTLPQHHFNSLKVNDSRPSWGSFNHQIKEYLNLSERFKFSDPILSGLSLCQPSVKENALYAPAPDSLLFPEICLSNVPLSKPCCRYLGASFSSKPQSMMPHIIGPNDVPQHSTPSNSDLKTCSDLSTERTPVVSISPISGDGIFQNLNSSISRKTQSKTTFTAFSLSNGIIMAGMVKSDSLDPTTLTHVPCFDFVSLSRPLLSNTTSSFSKPSNSPFKSSRAKIDSSAQHFQLTHVVSAATSSSAQHSLDDNESFSSSRLLSKSKIKKSYNSHKVFFLSHRWAKFASTSLQAKRVTKYFE